MDKEHFDKLLKVIMENDNSTEEAINYTYEHVAEFMEKPYSFILAYHDYLYNRVDYGLGYKHTMIEVHVLTEINDEPGINLTTLANRWSRNTSTMSKMISDLEEEGLLFRERNKDNRKILDLYVTDKGKKLVLSHKQYDNNSINEDFEKMLKTIKPEDLLGFYNVVKSFTELIEERLDTNK